MQIVILSGMVYAMHDDSQPMDGLYPGGEVLRVPAALVPRFALRSPDPRPSLTPEELAQIGAGPRKLTRVQFLQRLTAQEWTAALDSTVAEVRHLVAIIQAAEYIDLNDPATIAGLDLAVAAGVLTQERRAVVLE